MTSESPPVAVMRLVAEPARFAAVREAVREQLRAWGREDLADAAVLCATEILANVHDHTDSLDCELTLAPLPGPGEGVRLAVSDGAGVLLPQPSGLPVGSAERGRGLVLLAGTAERWGTVLTPGGGKQVWAVLR
jgi:hypothetical protein